MNDKIFCFQCHNSVYRVAQKGWLNSVAPGDTAVVITPKTVETYDARKHLR